MIPPVVPERNEGRWCQVPVVSTDMHTGQGCPQLRCHCHLGCTQYNNQHLLQTTLPTIRPCERSVVYAHLNTHVLYGQLLYCEYNSYHLCSWMFTLTSFDSLHLFRLLIHIQNNLLESIFHRIFSKAQCYHLCKAKHMYVDIQRPYLCTYVPWHHMLIHIVQYAYV